MMAASIVVAAIGLSIFSGLGAANADPSPGPSDEPNITVRIPARGGNAGPGTTPTPSPTSPTASAPPVAPNPSSNAAHLTLDRRRAHLGDVITATGHSFTAGEPVQFVVYPERIVFGSYPTGANGTIVAQVTLPKMLGTGEHVVEATGWVSHRVANSTLTIIAGSGQAAVSPTWMAWAVGAGGLLCGIAAFVVAFANGWLPFLLGARSVA
jgi:hypothetical protein